MCKTCFRGNEGVLEWESKAFPATTIHTISAAGAFKCIWKRRQQKFEKDSETEGDSSCLPIDNFSLKEERRSEGEFGCLNKDSRAHRQNFDYSYIGTEESKEKNYNAVLAVRSLACNNSENETELWSSSSGDQVLEGGKLEAEGHLSPSSKTRGHRPFFYLPTGDDNTVASGVKTDKGTDSDILNNPDLYPVPKGAPSEICYTSDSPPSKINHEGITGSKEENKSLVGAGVFEENIQSRILECLARARSRSTGSNSGSFEAGLHRLESFVKEFDIGKGSPPNSLVHQFFENGNHDKSGKRSLMTECRDAGTVTDVCSGDNIPEVEIISLIQEQIPTYKLKADVISEFSGYDNEGWTVSFPALKDSEVEALSPEQAEGALAYFVLCGNRVSQMTRTYHDIEAVTRLLQEKEKDLELAARIGQQLLARNKCLEEKNANLEAELASSAERITQLKHDLLMKTDLLQIYTNDVDESSVESTPTGFRHINIDLLQRRVKNLENENVTLREEASQLACDTQYCEEKEKELVNDVIKQLNDANLQVAQMSEELSKKIEDNLRLQEETTQLLAQVVELQNTAKRLSRENEELASLVGVARECQQELTTELAELKEKYAEVLDLLHDTQEQLRRAQKKNFPGSRGSHLGGSMYSSYHSAGSDSIASELHSLSSGEEAAEKVDGVKSLNRVFDTVRLSGKFSGSLPSGGSVYSTPTRQASQLHSHLGTPLHTAGRYSPFFGSCGGTSLGYSSGLPSLDSGAESDGSFPTDSEDNYPASRPGVPGWPGTPDLDSCLRRLGPHERSHLYLPYGCRTPDSIMSTGSAKSGLSGYASQDWKLPQKLQIVKPIEGSLTLHQWSRLATPHLGGLLEEKEGIAMKVKGITNTDLNLEVYSMSDLEEDEETELEESKEEEELEAKGYPGKQFMTTSGVFTYTNSTVLHPDDLTNLTSSLKSTQMSALPSGSIAPSLPPTPSHTVSVPPSRRGSTATFSTNFGIAKHLNERVFADAHSGSGITATATPANSPDGSRKGSPEPQTYKLPGIDDLTRHIHAGASFLRRTFYGKDYSNPPSPPGCPEFNIVERVQEMGVQKLVGTSRYSQSVGGVVTLRSHTTPPLLHLSNLIRSGAKTISGNAHTVTISSSYSSTPQPTTIVSSSDERKPELPQGTAIGIPGHPGAGHLDSRLTQLKPGQRRDLGTVGNVGNRPRPSTLGTIPPGKKDEKMGTVGWTSLGRKGGLL